MASATPSSPANRRLHRHFRSRRIHLLNGLYDARLDHQPVLAIVGQQARAALGGHYQQEIDLRACSRMSPARSSSRQRHRRRSAISIDRAMRIA